MGLTARTLVDTLETLAGSLRSNVLYCNPFPDVPQAEARTRVGRRPGISRYSGRMRPAGSSVTAGRQERGSRGIGIGPAALT